MDLKSKIILISGPTASGKSKFAVKLAKKIKGEIINADSMQVYKELRILTARPLKKDYNKIKHYLYGFESVKKKFSGMTIFHYYLIFYWMENVENAKKKYLINTVLLSSQVYFCLLVFIIFLELV